MVRSKPDADDLVSVSVAGLEAGGALAVRAPAAPLLSPEGRAVIGLRNGSCPRSCRLHQASASSSDQRADTRSSIVERSRAVCRRLARFFSKQARIACSNSAETLLPNRCDGGSGIALKCCWHSSLSVWALNAVWPVSRK